MALRSMAGGEGGWAGVGLGGLSGIFQVNASIIL